MPHSPKWYMDGDSGDTASVGATMDTGTLWRGVVFKGDNDAENGDKILECRHATHDDLVTVKSGISAPKR